MWVLTGSHYTTQAGLKLATLSTLSAGIHSHYAQWLASFFSDTEIACASLVRPILSSLIQWVSQSLSLKSKTWKNLLNEV